MPQPTPVREIAVDASAQARRPEGAEGTDVALSGIGAKPQLFRSEALAERQTQWLGTVLLAPRLWDHLFTLVALLAMAAVLGLLFLGDFTRTAKIGGWLVPQEGLVRVFAPQPGVVTALYAKEGAEVHKGERLLALSAELQSSALGATQAEIARRLVEQRQNLSEERRQQERLLAQQQGALGDRVAALRAELAQIDREVTLLKSRVAIAERTEALHRDLRDQGFLSDMRLQQVEADRIEQSTRLSALERQRITLQRDRLALEGELKDLPLKAQTGIATLERNISVVEQGLAQAEAQREIVVPAPQDGTVTAILAELGGHANAAAPLLSIVPAGAKLEAHLYSPSRAVGFVRPGQRVLLRYQAYPYQKFGHYEGEVVSVSRSAVSPGELPPQLAGIPSITGPNGVGVGAGAEPVYRITVKLERQAVTAYGEQVPLQPGMQLDADVALETRRLFEWVLDPLYTLTGKSQG
jgi:membrane fusion protein